MPERQLIVNADDYGLTPGVSRGIAEAMTRGIVTSTSVLVNMPGWQDAVARLHDVPARSSIGLHLNLVAGRPLTDAASLVDRRTGHFHTLPRFLLLAAGGRLDQDEIAMECGAQLERLRATGVRVTHADSHRHVHVLPIVADAIAPVLDGLPLRHPVESLPGSRPPLRGVVKRWLIAGAMGVRLGASPRNARADHFVGISLQGSARFAARLARLVDQLPAGTTELMVHPGYVDDALPSVDDFVAMREEELLSLTSLALRQRLQDREIALVAERAARPAA